MSYLHDTTMVGTLRPAADVVRRPCGDDDAVYSVRLKLQLPKCGFHGGDRELAMVAAAAVKLRIEHQLDGFTTVGTPPASAVFTCKNLNLRAEAVQMLVESMEQLAPAPSDQVQVLFLRPSLQARMTHLERMEARDALVRTCASHMLQ